VSPVHSDRRTAVLPQRLGDPEKTLPQPVSRAGKPVSYGGLCDGSHLPGAEGARMKPLLGPLPCDSALDGAPQRQGDCCASSPGPAALPWAAPARQSCRGAIWSAVPQFSRCLPAALLPGNLSGSTFSAPGLWKLLKIIMPKL